MAEPLTSSDIIRERMGFGVSDLATPETRRAYAAAGLSPLGTQERQRFEEGRGISPMATRQEQEAWKQAEFMAGRREQAPISYGGIGDRPVGTSRRAIRMQAEWDKQQQEQLQQQRLMQQMDMEQKTYEINRIREERMQRAEQSAVDAALAKESRELEIENQADRVMKSILGTTLPNGQRIRPINVNDEDAPERLQSIIASNPYGMESQIVKETVSTMLNDALDIRQKNIEAQVASAESATKEKVSLAKDLGAYGMSIADFTENGVVDFEKANEAIGKAYAAGKVAESEMAETKEQRSKISDKINSAEKELLKIRARAASAQKRLEARPNNKDFQTEFDAAVTEQSIMEDEINRLNRALGGEPQRPQESATPQAGGQQPQQRELSQQDQVALNWANANPNDPRSQRIKAKLGVQ